MDVLADVFAALRIGGIIYAQTELAAPWGMRFDRSTKAGFHVVVRGHCWLRTEETTTLELQQGDVVLLPRGWTHSVADSARGKALPFAETLARHTPLTRTARTTRLICGAYELAPEATSLLRLLPPVLHIPSDRATDDLRTVIALLAKEAAGDSPGSTAATARLADILLLYVLRSWLVVQPEGHAGWLGALRDPAIAKSLSILHAEVRSPLALEDVAKRVGLSRATFARRFTRLVGVPPLTYLARWRMTLAARELRESDVPLTQIATRVGYESEFAFNRAFKREQGISPGEYRKQSRKTARRP